MIAQGAEARVYLVASQEAGQEKTVVKVRFSKKYRHGQIDAKITKQRFQGEVRCMTKASKAGIDVPKVIVANKMEKQIVMEYIDGITVKALIEDAQVPSDKKMKVAQIMGRTVARLHDIGLVHGDLTTSNFMIRNGVEDSLTVIDFGLASNTRSIEDMGVDLYVLERAFLSTHSNSEDFFQAVLNSYVLTCAQGEKVKAHFLLVQQRGRKREAFG